MTNKTQFITAILTEGALGTSAATYIRSIFEQIQLCRDHDFEVSTVFSLDNISQTKNRKTPEGKTRHVSVERETTAILTIDEDSTEHLNQKGREEVFPETLQCGLQDERRLEIDIRRFHFPSARIAQRAVATQVRLEDVDITILGYLGSEAGVSNNEKDANFSSKNQERWEDLARFVAASALNALEHKRVLIVSDEDDKDISVGVGLKRSSMISEMVRSKSPLLTVVAASTSEAIQLYKDNPLALNGLVVAEQSVAVALTEHVAIVTGGQTPHAKLELGPQSLYSPDSEPRRLPGRFSMPKLIGLDGQTIDLIQLIQVVCHILNFSFGLHAESDALAKALGRTIDPPELIGSDMLPEALGGAVSSQVFLQQVLLHFTKYLEAVCSSERARRLMTFSNATTTLTATRRPMSLIEKILTHHAIGLTRPEVSPGDMICVSVDWTITSELLWAGMEKTYDAMSRPRLYRNDRVWLAVDHTVDPRTNKQPRQMGLIRKAEKFREEAKIIDFLPANTSIMHTDFTRERAQPGYLVVGSDSHTCSAGSMGALAVGFGAADVVMPLVTGETWFRVPEVCRINFIGRLSYGISGKDVILHILGLFKRNTIAFQRAVEYGGPGLGELSLDARFAIANMTTEFGGMGACFESDERTVAWLADRRLSKHKNRALYFKPDTDAQYAEVRTIDLSQVQMTMALYPNPDDVVTISEKGGMLLDGCFIGACTTTEEELILAALVLEAGLRDGLKPVRRGKRRVTPGSLIIIRNLEKLGLLNIYNEAGFDVGAPGCSYCVGINDVDVAADGEVWLSSQNRNFRNRMGKGGIGNITCAAAVAASSFTMEVTDPKRLLGLIDSDRYHRLMGRNTTSKAGAPSFQEPVLHSDTNRRSAASQSSSGMPVTPPHWGATLRGRVQRFGDNVDTDAIIPAQFMPGVDDTDLGSHCFEYFRPTFRHKAAHGATIIVAERGFGSGSSREDAVRALKGAGVQMVIAKSFAFIYERNQLNMGLFNARIGDDEFYLHATDDAVLTIDRLAKTIRVEGIDREWKYEHSSIEESLLQAGGVLEVYKMHGKDLFRQLTRQHTSSDGGCQERAVPQTIDIHTEKTQDALAW